jgi:cytoskeletal protein CcmA (bactofilin family)
VFGRNLNPPPKSPGAFPASDAPAPSFPAPAAPAPAASSGASHGASVIGPDLTIIGERITLVCKSRLVVTGEIVGDISGGEVTIGETGKVTGTVSARSINVQGTVKGALRAATVTLHDTAHIDGDIMQKNLVIAEGAHFDGRVRAAADASELEPVLDPAQITRDANIDMQVD